MAEFDFHRRRLDLRLRLIGSDPAVSRALLKRWAKAAGPRAQAEPDALRLPAVPLADLTGFDVRVRIEQEGGAPEAGEGPDACVLVLGAGVRGEHDLRVLHRRSRDAGSTGPALWAAEQGWSETLAAAARKLGVEDDVLRDEVRTRRGALACLEVGLACLIDHALLRVHPAAPGEGAPDALAVAERVRVWARAIGAADAGETSGPQADSSPTQPASASRGASGSDAASPDEPWRRRTLEMEKIEPLSSGDAAAEIETLDLILKFSPPLLELAGTPQGRETRTPSPTKGRRKG